MLYMSHLAIQLHLNESLNNLPFSTGDDLLIRDACLLVGLPVERCLPDHTQGRYFESGLMTQHIMQLAQSNGLDRLLAWIEVGSC